MAKTKTSTKTEHEASDAINDPAKIKTGRFQRLGAVKVPQLKTLDDVPVFITITDAIKTEPKLNLNSKTGMQEETEIHIVRCVDLEADTGELRELVVGAALKSELEKYKGGNKAYVGLSFEITKHPPKEGRRAKQYSVFEIQGTPKA